MQHTFESTYSILQFHIQGPKDISSNALKHIRILAHAISTTFDSYLTLTRNFFSFFCNDSLELSRDEKYLALAMRNGNNVIFMKYMLQENCNVSRSFSWNTKKLIANPIQNRRAKGKIRFLMRDFVNMDVKDSEMKIKFKIYFLIHLHLIQHHHELVCKSD